MGSEPSKSTLALIDVNNFFVSCERVFQPKLEKAPVIILSHEGGCVVARSNQSKALGIGMGVPYYQIENLVEQNNVEVLVANFSLYADLSSCLMQLLRKTACELEVYSIDEAFLDLSNIREPVKYVNTIRKRINQCLGLPVSIGLGPNKTLSKMATQLAKASGLFSLLELNTQIEQLGKLSVSEVWGIGTQTTCKLERYGIYTATDLRKSDVETMKKRFNIQVANIVLELNGKKVFTLEKEQIPKQIMVSRSFGEKIFDLAELKSALKSHISTAAQKLRAKKLKAFTIKIFLEDHYLGNEINKSFNFLEATSDTGSLIKAGIQLLTELYPERKWYRKVGVVLHGLKTNHEIQSDLFSKNDHKQELLMNTLDKINQLFGKEAIFYSKNNVIETWRRKTNLFSPAFTTSWKDLPIVYSK